MHFVCYIILVAVCDHMDAPPSAGSTQRSVDLSVCKALLVDNDANFEEGLSLRFVNTCAICQYQRKLDSGEFEW